MCFVEFQATRAPAGEEGGIPAVPVDAGAMRASSPHPVPVHAEDGPPSPRPEWGHEDTSADPRPRKAEGQGVPELAQGAQAHGRQVARQAEAQAHDRAEGHDADAECRKERAHASTPITDSASTSALIANQLLQKPTVDPMHSSSQLPALDHGPASPHTDDRQFAQEQKTTLTQEHTHSPVTGTAMETIRVGMMASDAGAPREALAMGHSRSQSADTTINPATAGFAAAIQARIGYGSSAGTLAGTRPGRGTFQYPSPLPPLLSPPLPPHPSATHRFGSGSEGGGGLNVSPFSSRNIYWEDQPGRQLTHVPNASTDSSSTLVPIRPVLTADAIAARAPTYFPSARRADPAQYADGFLPPTPVLGTMGLGIGPSEARLPPPAPTPPGTHPRGESVPFVAGTTISHSSGSNSLNTTPFGMTHSDATPAGISPGTVTTGVLPAVDPHDQESPVQPHTYQVSPGLLAGSTSSSPQVLGAPAFIPTLDRERPHDSSIYLPPNTVWPPAFPGLAGHPSGYTPPNELSNPQSRPAPQQHLAPPTFPVGPAAPVSHPGITADDNFEGEDHDDVWARVARQERQTQSATDAARHLDETRASRLSPDYSAPRDMLSAVPLPIDPLTGEQYPSDNRDQGHLIKSQAQDPDSEEPASSTISAAPAPARNRDGVAITRDSLGSHATHGSRLSQGTISTYSPIQSARLSTASSSHTPIMAPNLIPALGGRGVHPPAPGEPNDGATGITNLLSSPHGSQLAAPTGPWLSPVEMHDALEPTQSHWDDTPTDLPPPQRESGAAIESGHGSGTSPGNSGWRSSAARFSQRSLLSRLSARSSTRSNKGSLRAPEAPGGSMFNNRSSRSSDSTAGSSASPHVIPSSGADPHTDSWLSGHSSGQTHLGGRVSGQPSGSAITSLSTSSTSSSHQVLPPGQAVTAPTTPTTTGTVGTQKAHRKAHSRSSSLREITALLSLTLPPSDAGSHPKTASNNASNGSIFLEEEEEGSVNGGEAARHAEAHQESVGEGNSTMPSHFSEQSLTVREKQPPASASLPDPHVPSELGQDEPVPAQPPVPQGKDDLSHTPSHSAVEEGPTYVAHPMEASALRSKAKYDVTVSHRPTSPVSPSQGTATICSVIHGSAIGEAVTSDSPTPMAPSHSFPGFMSTTAEEEEAEVLQTPQRALRQIQLEEEEGPRHTLEIDTSGLDSDFTLPDLEGFVSGHNDQYAGRPEAQDPTTSVVSLPQTGSHARALSRDANWVSNRELTSSPGPPGQGMLAHSLSPMRGSDSSLGVHPVSDPDRLRRPSAAEMDQAARDVAARTAAATTALKGLGLGKSPPHETTRTRATSFGLRHALPRFPLRRSVSPNKASQQPSVRSTSTHEHVGHDGRVSRLLGFGGFTFPRRVQRNASARISSPHLVSTTQNMTSTSPVVGGDPDLATPTRAVARGFPHSPNMPNPSIPSNVSPPFLPSAWGQSAALPGMTFSPVPSASDANVFTGHNPAEPTASPPAQSSIAFPSSAPTTPLGLSAVLGSVPTPRQASVPPAMPDKQKNGEVKMLRQRATSLPRLPRLSNHKSRDRTRTDAGNDMRPGHTHGSKSSDQFRAPMSAPHMPKSPKLAATGFEQSNIPLSPATPSSRTSRGTHFSSAPSGSATPASAAVQTSNETDMPRTTEHQSLLTASHPAPHQPRQRRGSLSRLLSRMRSRRPPLADEHTSPDHRGDSRAGNIPPVPAVPRTSESTASFGGGSQPWSPSWPAVAMPEDTSTSYQLPEGAISPPPATPVGEALLPEDVPAFHTLAGGEPASLIRADKEGEEPRPTVSGQEFQTVDPTQLHLDPAVPVDSAVSGEHQHCAKSVTAVDDGPETSYDQAHGFTISSVPPSSTSIAPAQIPMSDSLTQMANEQRTADSEVPPSATGLPTDGNGAMPDERPNHEVSRDQTPPEEKEETSHDRDPRNVVVRRTLILPADEKHRVRFMPDPFLFFGYFAQPHNCTKH